MCTTFSQKYLNVATTPTSFQFHYEATEWGLLLWRDGGSAPGARCVCCAAVLTQLGAGECEALTGHWWRAAVGAQSSVKCVCSSGRGEHNTGLPPHRGKHVPGSLPHVAAALGLLFWRGFFKKKKTISSITCLPFSFFFYIGFITTARCYDLMSHMRFSYSSFNYQECIIRLCPACFWVSQFWSGIWAERLSGCGTVYCSTDGSIRWKCDPPWVPHSEAQCPGDFPTYWSVGIKRLHWLHAMQNTARNQFQKD